LLIPKILRTLFHLSAEGHMLMFVVFLDQSETIH